MDLDGVRVIHDDGGARSIALLVLAVAAIALATGLLVESTPDSAPVATAEEQRPGRPATAGDAAVARAGAAQVVGVPPATATRPATRPAAAPRRLSDEALLAALQRAEARGTIEVGEPGDRAGIQAFPPPGTKPIKRGIVVPDDFALPPGYLRHYQTTDDGRQLPAVLMFHPDFVLVDANGNVVPIPPDRLVPPDLAPEGLAIELLDVPEPQVELIEPPGGRRSTAPR